MEKTRRKSDFSFFFKDYFTGISMYGEYSLDGPKKLVILRFARGLIVIFLCRIASSKHGHSAEMVHFCGRKRPKPQYFFKDS